ncbi:response regulator [Tenuifilum thalassicum]|uniref:Response regulator n=1 Tax=Tenuifilum thalassicum TaxID=2590900 RepID=A0A7D3XKR2_9BACT|nr:response regulator [Tenuifilum thalassicum]QKG79950.1 response regulator [Tenuifilum thalassicum]
MIKKILLVDDSALSRRLMKKALRQIANLQIIEVSDSLVVLETFLHESPDLILLDLTMEGINGLELLAKIKELNPNQKVIIASADIQKATIEEAMQKGAFGYITKPFNEAEIIQKVESALK